MSLRRSPVFRTISLPGTGEAEWLADANGEVAWLREEKFPQATHRADVAADAEQNIVYVRPED